VVQVISRFLYSTIMQLLPSSQQLDEISAAAAHWLMDTLDNQSDEKTCN
jgi:hypothetical protein